VASLTGLWFVPHSLPGTLSAGLSCVDASQLSDGMFHFLPALWVATQTLTASVLHEMAVSMK